LESERARWAIKRARQGAATTSIASKGERDDYVASRIAQNNRTADKFLFAGVAELAAWRASAPGGR
jgi:hypothetical protein